MALVVGREVGSNEVVLIEEHACEDKEDDSKQDSQPATADVSDSPSLIYSLILVYVLWVTHAQFQYGVDYRLPDCSFYCSLCHKLATGSVATCSAQGSLVAVGP